MAAEHAAGNRVNMILFPAIIMSMEIKLKHSFNLERKFILNELTFERIKNQFPAQTCVFCCRNMFLSHHTLRSWVGGRLALHRLPGEGST